MLSSLLSAFSFFKNIANIKLAAQSAYQVIVKLLAVLNVVETEIKGTPASAALDKYLPSVIKALNTIKDLADKYGKLLGIDPAATALEQTDAHTELKAATSALSVHV